MMGRRRRGRAESRARTCMQRYSKGDVCPQQNANLVSFQCQLAHGSPTAIIHGFSSPDQLYSQIADCFDIDADSVLFCTLNTHKLDMDKLLSSKVRVNDLIFAHLKGQRKAVEADKPEHAMGLIVTDNGAGKAFVKRVKQGSLAEKLCPALKVGDHLESLNGESLLGKGHFEVAKALRDIALGATFNLVLVEPVQGGFAMIGPRAPRREPMRAAASCGDGRQTLKFAKKQGVVLVEEDADEYESGMKLVGKLNAILENYVGVSDEQLATAVWELGKEAANPAQFVDAIAASELAPFQMPTDVVYDLWGIVADWKAGRLI